VSGLKEKQKQQVERMALAAGSTLSQIPYRRILRFLWEFVKTFALTVLGTVKKMFLFLIGMAFRY